MAASKVTKTFAANLRYFMDAKKIKQVKLAQKTGLGQTTISLYLRPDARNNDTASGQSASPTLARVEAIADALEVEVWELLRPLTPTQRDLIKSVEAVIAEQTKATDPENQRGRLGEIRPPKRRRAS
jgi:transcriptional regulator with XRE-family HTH domain